MNCQVVIDELKKSINQLKDAEKFHRDIQNKYQLAEWDRLTWTEYQRLLDKITERSRNE